MKKYKIILLIFIIIFIVGCSGDAENLHNIKEYLKRPLCDLNIFGFVIWTFIIGVITNLSQN